MNSAYSISKMKWSFRRLFSVFELEKESEEPLAYLILEKNKMVPRSLEIRKTTSECFGLWTSMVFTSKTPSTGFGLKRNRF
ncbi:hypothetical protein RIR_jg40002.t1 [Rhizophagus irregularis DAOM 181602=DAOM 197198]|nr:hypothetical protein RIR_jg40002.t1 [Rhizophagus irregularis DAOM 181602=DAOM 197198]